MTYVSEYSNTPGTSEGLLGSFQLPMLGQFPRVLLISRSTYAELYGEGERGCLGCNNSSILCHVALSKLPKLTKSEISLSAKSYLPCKLT